ncbi:cytochrome b5 [Tilletiaria anomala UBC 951]|uniref:Cytochrome b5 n=1 Tax=Tilletiaria anomala (strain ATCC 24038 / CBS 436.72 / UBC 951) TaxID=1037660 RepID=A0A066W4J1_TILAU|nr:cytochrome b5 [Tilletiaria anomala UBC 951]KDN48847.1 cytochrome b5 [Tilletiaria anomala UBC 951]
MPPPRTTANSAPAGVGGASGASLPVHSSLAASLRAPPTQASASSGLVVRSGTGIAPGSGRKKVVLEPGYGPLDWARLKSSSDLRGGITQLRKITPTELKAHANAEDAWSAFHGKVYNITPYLRYHPGGVKELMRVAGRDGTRLFMLTHSWVNIEAMIDSTMVGFLVPDG